MSNSLNTLQGGEIWRIWWVREQFELKLINFCDWDNRYLNWCIVDIGHEGAIPEWRQNGLPKANVLNDEITFFLVVVLKSERFGWSNDVFLFPARRRHPSPKGSQNGMPKWRLLDQMTFFGSSFPDMTLRYQYFASRARERGGKKCGLERGAWSRLDAKPQLAHSAIYNILFLQRKEKISPE